MLTSMLTFFLSLQVMVARFGIAKQTLLTVILFFPLFFFLERRRSTLLQSKIIRADNGNPGLFKN